MDFQTLWIQENQQNYGIASGLLKTRNLLVAPITSFEEHDNKQEDNLIPPGMKPTSDHPNERRIVRWLKSATIQSAPELVVQAETRFSQSPFVQECFQWHNQLRRRHLAPDLVLDAPVSTGRPNKFYNIRVINICTCTLCCKFPLLALCHCSALGEYVSSQG